MLPKITIKRATGNYQYDLVRQVDTKFYNVVVYKNTEPIWGGYYATSLLTKQNTEVKTKNGLCLDAAIDLLNTTLKTLST
ncbi:MAG TPA: hypothetical protein VN698_16785 [Bacteroidia bacterium]|nr:hypothetical protein [Bacteroidia bacterium]